MTRFAVVLTEEKRYNKISHISKEAFRLPEKKYRPLADELRPTELDDVVGQNHILGKGGLLRRII